jgi:hypothetical protein
MSYFLAALRIIQIERDKMESTHADEHELIMRKVFAGTISMIINSECDRDENLLFSFFPDDDKREVGCPCIVLLLLPLRIKLPKR